MNFLHDNTLGIVKNRYFSAEWIARRLALASLVFATMGTVTAGTALVTNQWDEAKPGIDAALYSTALTIAASMATSLVGDRKPVMRLMAVPKDDDDRESDADLSEGIGYYRRCYGHFWFAGNVFFYSILDKKLVIEDCIHWCSGLCRSLDSDTQASLEDLMEEFEFDVPVPGTRQHAALTDLKNLLQAKVITLNSVLAESEESE